MKQKLIELNGEVDKCTIIIEDFITTLWMIDRTNKQKIIKDILDLWSPTNQLDLIDIYRPLHLATAENILLKCSWNVSKTDHILDHKDNSQQIQKDPSHTVCSLITMELK